MSQSARILEHLRLHGAITPMDALRQFGCSRLSARILDLKRQGHKIATHMIYHMTPEGMKRFARYELESNL